MIETTLIINTVARRNLAQSNISDRQRIDDLSARNHRKDFPLLYILSKLFYKRIPQNDARYNFSNPLIDTTLYKAINAFNPHFYQDDLNVRGEYWIIPLPLSNKNTFALRTRRGAPGIIIIPEAELLLSELFCNFRDLPEIDMNHGCEVCTTIRQGIDIHHYKFQDHILKFTSILSDIFRNGPVNYYSNKWINKHTETLSLIDISYVYCLNFVYHREYRDSYRAVMAVQPVNTRTNVSNYKAKLSFMIGYILPILYHELSHLSYNIVIEDRTGMRWDTENDDFLKEFSADMGVVRAALRLASDGYVVTHPFSVGIASCYSHHSFSAALSEDLPRTQPKAKTSTSQSINDYDKVDLFSRRQKSFIAILLSIYLQGSRTNEELSTLFRAVSFCRFNSYLTLRPKLIESCEGAAERKSMHELIRHKYAKLAMLIPRTEEKRPAP